MKVYKFGGASVTDARGIRNLGEIISGETGELIIVVSAFGKTTNALEKLLGEWFSGKNDFITTLQTVRDYHFTVARELFQPGDQVFTRLEGSFNDLQIKLLSHVKSDFDFEYDQVVSFGEIWSTIIVNDFLKSFVSGVSWVDIRNHLITDDRYRDAGILWNESEARVRSGFDFHEKRIYVTQGFIGGTADGKSTTLGREGSDYTAAILANMLDAESVTVWKDVPGIMNADPKWMPGAQKMDEISYREAVEMTFSGAKIIHPKTIKPIHNKKIPFHVKSFLNPSGEGTTIKSDPVIIKKIPVYIRKENQVLISVIPNDFSFVMGDNLGRIFHFFHDHKIKVNLVEASAVSLDVCVDSEEEKLKAVLDELKTEFSVVYNDNVEMLSVRHYEEQDISRITAEKTILVEQRTRSTVRFVVRLT